ncbi:BLUF domain-containing protein [Pseudozyma hubeiensis]|nr:BLUF domain-containing protein [Pseudozyma hubeiensis]
MLHQRSTSSTSVGPMGGTRPTLHSEHPPSIPRSAQQKPYDVGAIDAFSRARPPASFTRTASSRNTHNPIPAKRPSSRHSSRQSSSDSIASVTTSSSFTRDSPSTSDPGSGEEDDLIQVVYTSSARSRHMTVNEVKSILRASRANNTGKGITGLLLYRDGSFAQFLEGPAHAVDSLYNKIERDQRHHGVICVLRHSVTKRDFRQWSMAFRDLDMLKRRSPSSSDFDGEHGELAHEEAINDGFSQLMNVGLRVGDASDNEYRPDAMGNAKLDLPADMSASMRRLVTTFYRLMDRPL